MPKPTRRATMNISVPATQKKWIDRKVREGGYGTTSEFFRSLVREAMARQDALEESLAAALSEAPLVPMTDTDWARIRREARKDAARARHASPRRKSA